MIKCLVLQPWLLKQYMLLPYNFYACRDGVAATGTICNGLYVLYFSLVRVLSDNNWEQVQFGDGNYTTGF
jgi:hypothetical protein